ncbi:MAG: NfeD family protein [Gammaproteobacteria bacterium]
MQITRRQRWFILTVETFSLAVLAVWILSRLDRLLEPTALFIAVLIIFVGDLVSALAMQRFAPAAITFAPGEKDEHLGRVIGGFDGNGSGQVLIRGERWQAETTDPDRVARGDRIRVVSRTGLSLLVEPID